MRTEMSLEKIQQFIAALEARRVQYMVIAGVGLDGKRGHLTRPHQDLDVLCSKDDLPSIEEVVSELGYSGKKYHDLYKVFDGRGGKVDIGLVSFEGDDAVTYGRIAITRFPRTLFDHPQRGHIGEIKLNIAPDELLHTWGIHSQQRRDAKYAALLEVDTNMVKRIQRDLREKS